MTSDFFNQSALAGGIVASVNGAEGIMDLDLNRQAAMASFRLIETGDADLAMQIIADDYFNREAEDDPGHAGPNVKGVDGFLATGRWLRAAFDEPRFKDLETLAEDDRVVVCATMTGRHAGSLQGIPPTGKRLQQRQIDLFRLRDSRIAEHRAQRDDLGLLPHLGWRPPVDG